MKPQALCNVRKVAASVEITNKGLQILFPGIKIRCCVLDFEILSLNYFVGPWSSSPTLTSF